MLKRTDNEPFSNLMRLRSFITCFVVHDGLVCDASSTHSPASTCIKSVSTLPTALCCWWHRIGKGYADSWKKAAMSTAKCCTVGCFGVTRDNTPGSRMQQQADGLNYEYWLSHFWSCARSNTTGYRTHHTAGVVVPWPSNMLAGYCKPSTTKKRPPRSKSCAFCCSTRRVQKAIQRQPIWFHLHGFSILQTPLIYSIFAQGSGTCNSASPEKF